MAYDIIKQRYQEQILLSDLASAVSLSPAYFQKLFTREMQESPLKCLLRVRMEQATHLMITHPSLSMTVIAHRCGFSSLAVFSRCFSQKYGKSPSVFATSLRQSGTSKPIEEKSAKLIIEDPEIVYFPGTAILYVHTSVFQKNLLDAFHSIKALHSDKFKNQKPGRMLGFFTHIHLAFQGDKYSLNYYAGIEVPPQLINKDNHKFYQIPEGKYACFTTSTSYHDLFNLAIKFKREWMDPRSLNIRDTYSVEHILETNKNSYHPCLKRKMYIPIQ